MRPRVRHNFQSDGLSDHRRTFPLNLSPDGDVVGGYCTDSANTIHGFIVNVGG